MKLYYTAGACSLACHITASEAGLTLKLEKVDLQAKKTEGGKDFLAVNPKGAVPALEMDYGQVLTENAVILQYLADKAPQTKLMARDGLAHWRLLELVNFIATELHKGFAPLWNPQVTGPVREVLLQNLQKKFDVIEKQLGDCPYLTGQDFTIADAYAFTVLNWAGMLKMDLGKWPKIGAFLQRVAVRPAVRKALTEEGLA